MFDDAMKIARAMETAERNSEEIQASLTASLQKLDDVVHRTQEEVVENAKLKCFRCKGAHSPSSCCFQKVRKPECWKCKKQGHVARACKSSGFAGKAKHKPTHQVRADSPPQARATESRSSGSDSERLYSVHVVGQKK